MCGIFCAEVRVFTSHRNMLSKVERILSIERERKPNTMKLVSVIALSLHVSYILCTSAQLLLFLWVPLLQRVAHQRYMI